MTRLQSALLELLKNLTSFLNENGIEYWLAYGSTLGAVRHDGFIPWDDDVDIYINGKDYIKLQKLFMEKEPKGLRLDDNKTEGYPFTFPKVIDTKTGLVEKRFEHKPYVGGVYIDIFPLFSISKNVLIRRVGYFFRYLNYVIVESHNSNPANLSSGRKFLARVLSMFSEKNAQKRLYRSYCKGFVKEDIFLSEPLQFTDKNIHYSKHFETTCSHRFEDDEMKIPGDYVGYLRSQYGDYMKYPPLENRKPSHSFSFVRYSNGDVEVADE